MIWTWESLIKNLPAGQVVPVIGRDLILVKNEENSTLEPLHTYLAKRWTKDLEIKYTDQSLGELSFAYPQRNIMKTTDTFFHEIPEEQFNFEPLLKLAEITDFRFFVSTTLDGLLVRALRKARGLNEKQVRVINYSLDKMSKTYTDKEEEDSPVTVINLFGSFGNTFKPAFDEEEMLEHFFTLSKNDKEHAFADYFMEQVRGKIFLFIGCDFPDWFMRFIIRIVTNERYIKRNLSDYIVWDEINKCRKLGTFLNQFNKNIYTSQDCRTGNVLEFIYELHDRWTKNLEKPPIRYEGKVFLSHNKQDKDKAEMLKKILGKKGIAVWLDTDNLDVGKHKKLIKEEIKKCKVFVPMVSNNLLSNMDSYAWKVEWAAIQGRLNADGYYGDQTFRIIPIIIDDTSQGDERIPDSMREYSSWYFERDRERILEKIQKGLKLL